MGRKIGCFSRIVWKDYSVRGWNWTGAMGITTCGNALLKEIFFIKNSSRISVRTSSQFTPQLQFSFALPMKSDLRFSPAW